MMIVLNFGNVLTEKQRLAVEKFTGSTISDIRAVRIPIISVRDLSLFDQVVQILDRVGFSPEEWRAGGYILNLPGASHIPTALVLALVLEMCDRGGGYLPRVICLEWDALDGEAVVGVMSLCRE
jgi:hypothetical protein